MKAKELIRILKSFPGNVYVEFTFEEDPEHIHSIDQLLYDPAERVVFLISIGEDNEPADDVDYQQELTDCQRYLLRSWGVKEDADYQQELTNWQRHLLRSWGASDELYSVP